MGLLKTYRCLKNKQIDRLVCMSFKEGDEYAKRHRVRLYSAHGHLLSKPLPDHLGMARAVPDNDLIASIDVMLEFRKQAIVTYRPGKPPFKLVFIKESEDGLLRAYHVAVVHKGAELIISGQAQSVLKGRKNAVIFLLDDISQAKVICAPYEHYYAVAGKQGYRFYKGGKTPEHES